MMPNEIVITRTEALVQPYAKNGNVGFQKPVYDWIVRVNGKYVGHSRMLRKAKDLANDFEGEVKVIR